MLARVPKLFLIQGSIYLALELVGFLIMAEFYDDRNTTSTDDDQPINNAFDDSFNSSDTKEILPINDEVNSLGVKLIF